MRYSVPWSYLVYIGLFRTGIGILTGLSLHRKTQTLQKRGSSSTTQMEFKPTILGLDLWKCAHVLDRVTTSSVLIIQELRDQSFYLRIPKTE
jgi:uncharacterized membrane protein